jgi:hypothetical protein
LRVGDARDDGKHQHHVNAVGAEATISGLDIPTACVTPCAIVAKRSADISVTFAKPGFETEVVTLTKEVPATGAAGFAGNVLAGGLIGMGVDAATGAAQDHKPNPVIVTMKPIGPARRGRRASLPNLPRRPGLNAALQHGNPGALF